MSELNRRIQFNHGFAAGLIAAHTVSSFILFFSIERTLDDTLVAAILATATAFIVAFVTVGSIRKQIEADESHKREVRRGLFLASRTQMLMPISELVGELDRTSSQILYPLDNFKIRQEIYRSCFECFGKCIENADEQSAKALSRILARIQIVLARHTELLESSNLASCDENDEVLVAGGVHVNRIDALADLLHLRASILQVFSFARLDSEAMDFHDALSEELLESLRFLRPNRPIEIHSLYSRIVQRISVLYRERLNAELSIDY